MFEVESEGSDGPQVQVQLHDITERMSLLLTSYEGPSDKLSQRLALKREKENGKMKGALFGVLEDFNQIVDEREQLLASIKDWFDGSSKLMREVNTDGNAEEVWEMIENEMKKLFGVLQTYKNSSKDVSELERRLLKVVFKDTNFGDLEKVRNKIQFNSFRKKAKFRMTSQSSLETVEETQTEFNTDPNPNRSTTNPICSVEMSSVEVQVDLLNDSQTLFVEKNYPKTQQRTPIRTNVALQTENMDLGRNLSNESIIAECLPNAFNNSVSCLEVSLSGLSLESNIIFQSNNADYSNKESSNNEINIPYFRQKNRLISSAQQKTSTPGKNTNISKNIPSVHVKNSPGLSPVLSPIPTLSSRPELGEYKLYNIPNLSFMQREQIKHDNIELYIEKSRGKSTFMKHRLLTPISAYSPKKSSVTRILGNIRTDSAQPTHIFKQDDETKKWGSHLVDFMKDMCIK